MLGVMSVHSGNNSWQITVTASSLISFRPLDDTITGSNTIYRGLKRDRHSAIARTVSASLTIPIFTASGWISLITAFICAAIYCGGTGNTSLTPQVFCTVTAVTALAAYTPAADIVLMSACIPAPPLQSDPAILSTQGYFFIIFIMFLLLRFPQ